jgi:hypothetical protein
MDLVVRRYYTLSVLEVSLGFHLQYHPLGNLDHCHRLIVGCLHIFK